MKKLKAVFSLCAMMLVLCGCSMKYEYGMSIKKDKSMEFSIITAFDNELIDGMLSMESENGGQSTYTDEQRWAALENDKNDSEDGENPEDFGFTVSKYEEGEYKGYKYVKKINNIDEISGETSNFKLQDFQNISDSIVFVKDGDKYKANLVLSSEEQSSSTEGYDIGIDMKFVVTLPNKPISHNATEVSEDGKTLTWNLASSDSQNIEFEFSFKNNTMLYIGIAAGILVFVILIAAIASNSKKRKGSNIGSSNVEQEPTVENKPNFLETTEQPTETQPQIAQEPVVQPEVVETTKQPVWSTEPVTEQTSVQPTEQPQAQPTQEMPSVADVMGLTNKNNNQ